MKQTFQTVFFFFALLLLQGCQTLSRDEALSSTADSDETQSLDADVDLPEDGDWSTGSEKSTKNKQSRNNTQRTGIGTAEDELADDPVDLWTRLRRSFALDLTIDDPRVDAEVRWFSTHQDYLDRTVTRASRYLYHITQVVESRGLPGELALLPIVESAFDPFAYSHGRASGPWQFIPSTGKLYGLEQNWWYDGRRDIIASTDAALRFLNDLAKLFDGDWMLALAAYNSGAGTVMKAMKRREAIGASTDFWSLSLPRETTTYAPKLIAIAKIIQNPERYGINLQSIPDEPYFGIVNTGSQIDLAKAAELAGIDIEELYLLNPALNRWATAPLGPHRLLVPIAQQQRLQAAIEQIPAEKRISRSIYTVRSGDSLGKIAAKLNTTPQVIKQINNLNSSLIRVGQQLMIPHVGHVAAADNLAPDPQRTLFQTQQNPKAFVSYQVQSGDTLWDIALAHKVSIKQLATWNDLSITAPLRVGQALKVGEQMPIMAIAETPARSNMIRKIGYRVRTGDSLGKIAKKFNLSVNDIMDWNQIRRKQRLRRGQNLILYVDIRNSP